MALQFHKCVPEVTGKCDRFAKFSHALTPFVVALVVANTGFQIVSGLEVCCADGTVGGYFLVADVSATGKTALEFCKWLAVEKKVAAVPLGVFYEPRPEDSTWTICIASPCCTSKK
jgi:hypothetical protein